MISLNWNTILLKTNLLTKESALRTKVWILEHCDVRQFVSFYKLSNSIQLQYAYTKVGISQDSVCYWTILASAQLKAAAQLKASAMSKLHSKVKCYIVHVPNIVPGLPPSFDNVFAILVFGIQFSSLTALTCHTWCLSSPVQVIAALVIVYS